MYTDETEDIVSQEPREISIYERIDEKFQETEKLLNDLKVVRVELSQMPGAEGLFRKLQKLRIR